MSYPDVCSLVFIDAFINYLRVEGFTEEEIRYAITRAYSKRIKKYECIEQIFPTSSTVTIASSIITTFPFLSFRHL
jgi:hypothetical protein